MDIQSEASARLPTRFGDFELRAFRSPDGAEHLALLAGDPRDGCLVRVHSECATGDVLGSMRCDCRDQLELSLQRISDAKSGVFIYLRGHEGRGIGLANKIKAYALQDKGLDTIDANITLGFAADAREYDVAVAILRVLKLTSVRLLTNNQKKVTALEEAGIKVEEQVSLWTAVNPHNQTYIATKLQRMGHLAQHDGRDLRKGS